MTTVSEQLKKMADLYERKNSDYGNSFEQTMNEFGLISAAIRLSDKLNRFKSLIKSDKSILVKDESISDTLIDLANYAVMTKVWLENHDLSSK